MHPPSLSTFMQHNLNYNWNTEKAIWEEYNKFAMIDSVLAAFEV